MTQSNLVSYKLVNGEDIIAEYIGEDELVLLLKNVVTYDLSENTGGVFMKLWTSLSNDDEVQIEKKNVLATFYNLTPVTHYYFDKYIETAHAHRTQTIKKLSVLMESLEEDEDQSLSFSKADNGEDDEDINDYYRKFLQGWKKDDDTSIN